jgi:hypothetical protein
VPVPQRSTVRAVSFSGTTRTRGDVDDPVGNRLIGGLNRDEQGV